MEHWKKLIILILIFAMPISLWASIAMTYHCQTPESSSHTMHSQIDDGQHMHMNHEVTSEDNDSNVDCACGCSGILDCSVSTCSVTGILNDSEIIFSTLYQPGSEQLKAIMPSPDPRILYRPPIFLS